MEYFMVSFVYEWGEESAQNEKESVYVLFFLMAVSLIPLRAFTRLDIKLRFYEGLRRGIEERSQITLCSSLESFFIAVINTGSNLTEEESQLIMIFNLVEVNLIEENEVIWRNSQSESVAHFFWLGDREYGVVIFPVDQARKNQFRVFVLEEKNQDKEILLDTTVILPWKRTTVVGLKDIHGKPYFISLHLTGGVVGGIVGGGVIGGVIRRGIVWIGRVRKRKGIDNDPFFSLSFSQK